MLAEFGLRFRWAVANSNARLLWIGRTSTFLAEQTGEIALTWFTWQLTHSSVQVGFMAFFLRMPFWMFGWLSGIYADRLPRKTVLIGANLMGAAIALSIPCLHVTGLLNYWVLLVVAFLFTLSRTIEFPALGAEIPELFAKEAVRSANAILDNAKRVGRLMGPVLSSFLQTFLAIPFLYLVVGFCLLIMSICASRFRTQHKVVRSESRPVFRELGQAWKVLREERKLFLVVICFFLYNPVYSIGYWILLPRFVGLEIAGSGVTFSLAIASFSLGALLGNLTIGAFPTGLRSSGPLLGFLGVGLGFALLSLPHSRFPVFATIALTAYWIPFMDIGISSMINERIPFQHQGKVFALFRYFAEIGLAIGLLGGGYLANLFGTRASLALLGCYIVPLIVVFHWAIRKLPDVEIERLDSALVEPKKA